MIPTISFTQADSSMDLSSSNEAKSATETGKIRGYGTSPAPFASRDFFRERYQRLKARRGHKKAIVAICRMLLTAIWNVLKKAEPYSPDGFVHERPDHESKTLTTSQALHLLKMRGYIIKDDPVVPQSA